MNNGAEVANSPISRFVKSPLLGLFLFLFGVIVALLETIYLLILGNTLENAVWPLAIRTLEWTMVLRNNVPAVTTFAGLILAASMWLMVRRQQNKPINAGFAYAAIICSGFIIGSYAVFVIMDLRYLRGAFLLLPTIYGVLLFSSAIIARGVPKLPKSKNSGLDNFYSLSHLFAVFLAAWLMMPGIPALVGMAPSPPEKPIFGYGGEPGPFLEVLEIYPYELPENVTAIQGDTEEDIEFSIYLSIPILPETPGIEGCLLYTSPSPRD